MTRVLVIDNYDSFVYTLNGYLQELGAETEVVRNDAIEAADVPARLAEYDAVLISPGPGKPADAGVSIPVVEAALATGQPLLGVCLGHQAIAEAFGATVTNAEELMHGKTSRITHDDSDFYDGVPQPFTATRYHSLAVVDGSIAIYVPGVLWLARFVGFDKALDFGLVPFLWGDLLKAALALALAAGGAAMVRRRLGA